MVSKKLLTIAIPTYNRGWFLKESLKRILEQIKGLEDKIELLISNNCSTDNTEQIILSYIEQGVSMRYNCNKKNLGMDGNFVYCFENASAKYVWVLGDDDYLLEGVISRLVEIIQNGEYGLIHLDTNIEENLGVEIFENRTKFIGEISYMITFISANIVRTEYVSKIDFSNYMGSYFTLIPVYLTAAISEKNNLMVRFKVLDTAKSFATNGGYNVFQVFVENYLNIIKEFRPKLTKRWYTKEKKNLFVNIVNYWINHLLLTKNHELNYSTQHWRKIIFLHYWREPYLYPTILKFCIKKLLFCFKIK